MKEVYYPTKLEVAIFEIVKNFKVVTEQQLQILFERHGKTPEQVTGALRDLWNHGWIFHNKEGKLWKIDQQSEVDIETLSCIYVMLECTEGKENELDIYKNVVFGGRDYLMGFIADGYFYYIQYLLNDAAAISVRLLQERLVASGDEDSRADIRIILVAPTEEIFDKVCNLEFPTMYMLMHRNGYDVQLETL